MYGYHIKNYIAKKSGLNLSAYNFLFHEAGLTRQLAQNWTSTYCYRLQQRDVWSVHPGLSHPFEPIVGEDRRKRLINFVTQHRNTYTVGPLDYCGIAKLVRGSGQNVYVSFS